MKIVRFEVAHLWQIRVQPDQVREFSKALNHHYADYLASGIAYTAIDGGRVVGIAGIVESEPGVGILWGVVAEGSRQQFLGMWRAVRRLLEACRTPCVRTITHFAAGCRALELLGFHSAGRLGSSEHISYVRTR